MRARRLSRIALWKLAALAALILAAFLDRTETTGLLVVHRAAAAFAGTLAWWSV
jgi:hypothetical protein